MADKYGLVRLVEYKVAELAAVRAGDALAEFETRNSRFLIEAATDGNVKKIFFDPGNFVRVGDPVAIMICDGEKAPGEKPTSKFRRLPA